MRGTIPGLPSPLPLANTLPGLLRADRFAENLCASFDEVLAPVLLSLDGFPAYLDLRTAPEDMVEWLAQWLGMTIDPNAAPAQQRQLLESAGELHARRGTRRGLQLAVEAELGVPVQVVETGASSWSTQPGGELPGEPVPAVVVVARPPAGQVVDTERLDALVRAIKPAHIQHRVQVAPE
jgi:phage tail-like protein